MTNVERAIKGGGTGSFCCADSNAVHKNVAQRNVEVKANEKIEEQTDRIVASCLERASSASAKSAAREAATTDSAAAKAGTA